MISASRKAELAEILVVMGWARFVFCPAVRTFEAFKYTMKLENRGIERYHIIG